MTDLSELPDELRHFADVVRQARNETTPTGDAGDQVWARISAELGDELLGTTTSGPPTAAVLPGRETRSGSPSTASSAGGGLAAGEPTVVPIMSSRVSRRAALGWAAGGLAAGVAITLLGRQLLSHGRTVATAGLVTLDAAARELGRALLVEVGDHLVLQVRATQTLSNPDGYLEAWLINTDGARMISLGQFREGESADYVVDAAAWEGGFRIVDISRERYDGAVQHSGDSVVRGQLA